MLTKESSSHPKVKEAILKTDKPPTVSIPKGTALLARDLRNEFTQTYLKLLSTQPDPAEVMKFLAEHSQNRAQAEGDSENGEICCGQVASLVKSISSVAEVFEEIKKGMSPSMAALQGKISEFS